MKKFLFFIIIFVYIFQLFSYSHILAADFSFIYDINNTVTSDYKLISDYNVTITNNIGTNFIDKTKLSYPFIPQVVHASSSQGDLVTSYQKLDDMYIISVSLPPLLNKGSKISYKLEVISSDAILKKGNIYDISIPGLESDDSIKINTNTLKVSTKLNPIKYISSLSIDTETSQKLDVQDKDYTHFIYNNGAPVSLVLGQSSKYKYKISVDRKDDTVYGPLNDNTQSSIFYGSSISPLTTDISRITNNLSLKFPSDSTNIDINGEVQLNTDMYKQDNNPGNSSFTNTVWSYDQRLDSIVDTIKKENTFTKKIQDCFQYIIENFKYDANTQVERKDIKGIFQNKDNLNSLNITDLAITILKESNISTSLVGGFTDTQLSSEFINKNLHYWIEYYDPQWNGWKYADPTLQVISPADNYYNGVGLSHIALFKSFDGKNIPESNYSIDAKLENGTISNQENITLNIENSSLLAGKDKTIDLSVKNNGNTISFIDTLQTSIRDEKDSEIDQKIEKYIFPGQIIQFNTEIKNDNFYVEKQKEITATINTKTNKFNTTKSINFTKSNSEIWIGLILILLLVMIIVFIFFFYKRSNTKRI